MTANRGLLSWFFQRISALFLIVGLVTHFFVLHFMIERPVTMEKVAERLKGTGWVVFDSILLLLCIYHALNGLNSILLDFKPGKAFGRFVLYSLWAIGILTAVWGIINLLPFNR